ncbi:MAG: hypothetical protein AAFW66_03615, partial [Pseudomonadota bacterium]
MSGFFENGLTPVHALLVASIFLAVVVVELGFLIFDPNSNSKKRINRRMNAIDPDKKISQKNILLQLRKERGLDEEGKMALPLRRLNSLIVQSGLTLGLKKLGLYYLLYVIFVNFAVFVYFKSLITSLALFPILTFALPYMWLRSKAKKKTAKFA